MKSLLNRLASLVMLAVFTLASCVTPQNVTITPSDPDVEILVNGTPLGKGRVSFVAKSGKYEVSTQSPDYRDLKQVLGPTIHKANVPSMEVLGYVFGGLGAGAYIVGNVVFKEPGSFSNLIVSAAGGLYMALGGLFYLIAAPSNTYPSRIDLDLSELSLYDSSGFHVETGLDHWGVDRKGTFPDGSNFSGKVTRGKMQGPGAWTVPSDGIVYVANFVNSEAQGLTYIYPLEGTDSAQVLWVGFYKDGVPHGAGLNFENGRPATIETWAAGTQQGSLPYPTKKPVVAAGDYVYISDQLKNGLAQGLGEALTLDGKSRLSGQFDKGQLIDGTRVLSSGEVQTGHFVNGVLQRGSITQPDSTSVTGDWVSGVVQSPAKFVLSDGSVYSGDHMGGVFDGTGTLVLGTGGSYVGRFHAGKYEGKGEYTFPNGGKYTGDFVDGTFEGKGKLVKANGETFDGPFEKGLPNGLGIYKYQGTPERAEYYEGTRIDQAYLIRQENEKVRITKALEAEEAERQRVAAEQARIEAEQRAENRRQEEARQAQAAQTSKALFGVGLGLITGGLVASHGGNAVEAFSVGVATTTDVMQGTLGSSSSALKSTTQSILASRGIASGGSASSISATSSFMDSPSGYGGSSPSKGSGPTATPISPESNHFADAWPSPCLSGTFAMYASIKDMSSLGIMVNEAQLYPSFVAANLKYAEYVEACKQGDKALATQLKDQHRALAAYAIEVIDAYVVGDKARAKYNLRPNGSVNMREPNPNTKNTSSTPQESPAGSSSGTYTSKGPMQ